MLSAAEVRDSLNVVDDQIGSPTFTDQVVLWTRELLKREVTGTFHITSGGLTSWHGLASEIFRYRGNERRSEERRVGKECREGGARGQEETKVKRRKGN